MRVNNYELYNEATTSTGIVNSKPICLDQAYGLTVQASWSGNSGSATLTLQASNDGSTWADLTETVSVSGASGSDFLYSTDFHYRFARVEINAASDITNLVLHVNAKGF